MFYNKSKNLKIKKKMGKLFFVSRPQKLKKRKNGKGPIIILRNS